MHSWFFLQAVRCANLHESSTGRPSITIEIEQPEWPLGTLHAMGIPNAPKNQLPQFFWHLGHAYLVCSLLQMGCRQFVTSGGGVASTCGFIGSLNALTVGVCLESVPGGKLATA